MAEMKLFTVGEQVHVEMVVKKIIHQGDGQIVCVGVGENRDPEMWLFAFWQDGTHAQYDYKADVYLKTEEVRLFHKPEGQTNGR